MARSNQSFTRLQELRIILGRIGIVFLSVTAGNLFGQTSLFDTSFDIKGGANGTVYAILALDDGKILVGGEFTRIAGQPCSYLARLFPNGQLDNSFPDGTDGVVYRLLKQADGKILVGGGFTNLIGSAQRCLGRILTNDLIDSNFEAGMNYLAGDVISAIAVQNNGRVLAATGFTFSGANQSLLKRFEPDGQLDNSFIQTNVFKPWYIYALLPRTNGTILVSGGFKFVNTNSSVGLALLDSDGGLNTNYNFNFKTGGSLTSADSIVAAMVNHPDQSVSICGSFKFQSESLYKVHAKLAPALNWDTNYHPADFDLASSSVFGARIGMTMVLQSDGKMVLGGEFQEVGGYWRRSLVRLDTQGQVDPCFDPGLGVAESIYALAQDTSGKVLAGGDFRSFDYSRTYTNLTRFLPQTDCNMTLVHLGKNENGTDFVAGTCSPGGTNRLQMSTNLTDWTTLETFSPPTRPLVYFDLFLNQIPVEAQQGGFFFRVKKEF
jgi:uncharacterized delta-60 repeat protein